MKRVVLALMLFLMVLILSACAHMGPQYSVLQPSLPDIKSETGRVFFYRPVAFGGAVVQPVIKLNEKEIGISMLMGFFYLDLPPGNYTAEVTTEVTRKVSFTLEKGEVRYIRFHVTRGFFNGELVSEKLALEELKTCKYSTGASCDFDKSKPIEVLEKCKYSPKPKNIEKYAPAYAGERQGDGRYIGIIGQNVNAGGRGFDGETILVGSVDIILVPEIENGYGWGLVFGNKTGNGATEIAYMRSEHDVTWLGFKGDATLQHVDINWKRYFRTEKPVQPYLQFGWLPCSWLVVKDASANKDGEVGDATFLSILYGGELWWWRLCLS